LILTISLDKKIFVKNVMKTELDPETIAFIKSLEANKLTQSYKKIWAYFEEIIKSDYVQNKIISLRKRHNIPENGFEGTTGEWSIYSDQKVRKEIWNEFEEICKKYHLSFSDWLEILQHYLLFNHITREHCDHLSCNLCLLLDQVQEKEEYELEKKEGIYTGFLERSDDFAFPIAIRISPYASQRDIVDYVKRMYPAIKKFQERYVDKNIKIGKIKKKDKKIQERNDFIYENRDKPIKEIRKLLTSKKIFLDDGHIAKIISLEKQRRKEV
jgi:hypothetical protein